LLGEPAFCPAARRSTGSADRRGAQPTAAAYRPRVFHVGLGFAPVSNRDNDSTAMPVRDAMSSNVRPAA
jgi:hypothetical protein